MRASGILMPVFSLPGPYGIGTLGNEAFAFVDFLAAAKQTYWQILPIGPTGYGDSPYQSFSAFAGNPYFILPILAAAFTFLSTWLTNKAAKDRSAMLLVMNIMLPIFIFWFGTQISSGVALYWAVSNAFQVIQILVFNNPFKIIEERNRLEMEEKERKAKIRRAKKKAHKRK